MAKRQDRLNRIQLVARVQIAYEQLRDTMRQYRDDSPKARIAIAAAKQRLTVLNRALAMMALESVSAQPA